MKSEIQFHTEMTVAPNRFRIYSLLMICLIFPFFGKSQTFFSTGGTIPNNTTGNCFTVLVSGVGTISPTFGMVRVCLSIDQPRPTDLDITLTSPAGTVVSLSTDNGGTSGNDYLSGMCFSDCAPSGPITAGADYLGVFAPEGSLAAFNIGVNGNGVWTLCIDDDNATGGNGTLNFFSLSFESPTPIATPTGETCATAYPLTTFPFSHTCMTVATKVDDYSACGSNMDGADYLYSYTPSVSGEYLSMDISQDFSAPSGFPTISLLNACPNVATPANCLQTEIQMFSYENILHITSQPLTSGVTYYIVVASTSGTGGVFDVRIDLGQNGSSDCFNATTLFANEEFAGNNYGTPDPNTQAPSTAEMTCNGSRNNFIYYTFTTDAIGSTVYVNLTDVDCDLSCGGACGIQLALFQRPAGGPCLGPGTWGAPVQCETSTIANRYYRWSGLAPNTQYYLMVDGNAGSQCVWNLMLMGDLQQPLPVTLTQIQVVESGEENEVKWSTENEVNLNHYEIEHSLSVSAFENVGTVSAAGIEGAGHHYTFDHATPEAGMHYYRIRSVDHDGSGTYSEVVSILKKESTSFVTLFPNPAQQQIQARFSVKGFTTVKLLSPEGQLIQKMEVTTTDETSELSFDISSLTQGIYLIEILSENGKKLVKKFSKI
jgi:subtilisin-like proprotein convertase family protein